MQDNFTEKMKKMLTAAASGTPVPPEEIKSADSALTPEQREKLQALQKDPEAMRRFLLSPAVKKIMEKLNGEQ